MFLLTILSTILFFFCLYLYLDNKIIRKQLERLEKDIKTIKENKVTTNKEEIIPLEKQTTTVDSTNSTKVEKIDNIKIDTTEVENTNIPKKENTDIIKIDNIDAIPIESISVETISKEEIIEIKKKDEKQEEKNYETLEKVPYFAKVNEEEKIPEFKTPIETNLKKEPIVKPSEAEIEPVKIEDDKKEKTYENNDTDTKEIKTVIPNVTLTDSFDPSDFIKGAINGFEKEEKVSKPATKTNDYLKELTGNLTEEIQPQTIELTGYEKEQEEQAIISYKELLSLKEKLKNQDKQDEQFIETLKEIRRLLDTKI